MSKVRSIVFTINNYLPTDRQCILDWATENGRYCVMGYEEGEAEGTPHIQGYLQFNKPRGLNATKKKLYKLLDDRKFYIEKAMGSKAANMTYCKKGNEWVECGDSTSQGERADLDELKKDIQEGKSWDEIVPNLDGKTWLQYGRRIREEIQDAQPDRTWETEVLYIWGPTGCGKTRSCYEEYPGADFVEVTNSGFIQGYTNAETVIFDDFEWNEQALTRQQLLRMLDRYPMRVNVKGGEMKWNPRRIIFTNNFPPERTFSSRRSGYDPAIERRICTVRELGPDGLERKCPPGNMDCSSLLGDIWD